MSNIKIFVSHRTDFDSEEIKSSIYVPVKCGAALKKKASSTMLEDDTGENISLKKDNYSEFTVQFWAWKNIDADYYGLCHYRRYLSFALKNSKKRNKLNMICELAITPRIIKKYQFNSEKYIQSIINQYDIIYGEGSFTYLQSNIYGHPQTVAEMWSAFDQILFRKECLGIICKKIKKFFPEYYESAVAFLSSNYHIGFNLFVMKKALFNKLCEFQFSILSKIEAEFKKDKTLAVSPRALAYLGEILYGIYIYHQKQNPKLKIKSLPIVFFRTTTHVNGPLDYAIRCIYIYAESILRKISLVFFPIGSRRRELLKNYYFQFRTSTTGV